MCCLVLVLFLVGCGIENNSSKPDDENNPNKTDRVEKLLKHAEFSKADYEKIVSPINALGFSLIDSLPSDENVFVSPVSLYMALSMLYNGAAGETKEEIAEVLGMAEISTDDLSSANASLISILEKTDSEIDVSIANSIWMNDTYNFNQEFINRSQDYFLAEVEEIDVSKGSSFKKVNQWVSDATNNLITEIIEEQPDEDLVAMLINALYFKGAWSNEFDEENTTDEDFYLNDETVDSVQMMQQIEHFEYMENDTFQAVKLPYGIGEMSMNVFLPKKDTKEEEMLIDISTLGADFQQKSVDLRLPKFELGYEIVLNDLLIDLGMPKAFIGDEADFSQMIEQTGPLFIDIVKQKTFIEVDEVGTETAAVTSIAVKMESSILVKDDPIVMEVNRPFVFTIIDNETDAILFIGSIVHP